MTETTNLQIDIDEAGLRGSGNSIARIAVVEAHSFTRSGAAPTITADCTDFHSLELEVDRLKKELDTASATAKSHYQAVRQEQGAAIAERRRTVVGRSVKPCLEAELSVGDVMTTDVKTVGRNDRLSLADELMRLGHFRHVVVLGEQREVVGVISQRDIFYGALAWSTGQGKFAHDNVLASVATKEIMHDDPQLVSPEVPLSEAAALMLDQKIGCLPVVNGEELVGILTEGHFLSLIG